MTAHDVEDSDELHSFNAWNPRHDDVAIRDFGILLAALAVALWGGDR